MVVEQWLLDRLSYCLAGSEVDYSDDSRILLIDASHRLEVVAVGLVKLWPQTGDPLDPVEDRLVRVREVVDDDHLIPCFLKLYGGVGSDESRPARYQYCLFTHWLALYICAVHYKGSQYFGRKVHVAPEKLSGTEKFHLTLSETYA